jgi:hypothetical protein
MSAAKNTLKTFKLSSNINAEDGRDTVEESGTFTLMQLVHATDWQDSEFDEISDMSVGQTLTFDKGNLAVNRIS